MSLAPSVAVPRAAFNPLPLTIGLFCLLWSFAFVAGKIGVTDCPPLILLTARFSLAGILILGISALRGDAWSLSWRDALVFAALGVANNALYLGLGYTGLQTVSAGLGGLIVSANPVFTALLAALLLGETLTWRKVTGLLLGILGVGFIVWHRMSVGTDSLHGILFTLASLASIVARHHPVQAVGADGQPLDRQWRAKSGRWASCCCHSRSAFQASVRWCRARVFWGPSRSWCWAARCWPIGCGFICCGYVERPPPAPTIS